MHYEEIFRALNKHKIRYLVIGGGAVNLYGHIRATMDLDLLISMKREANRAIDMFDVSYLEHARRLKKRAKKG
jgi:hypothetical protein